MKHRHPHYRKHHRHSRNRNFVNQSMNIAKHTSKKYMPTVKRNIENVGSKVIQTSSESVPFLQRMTRKFFNLFGARTRKRH